MNIYLQKGQLANIEPSQNKLKIDYIGVIGTVTPINYVEEHSHSLWECVYYTGGSGVTTIGGIEYEFSVGDLFIIPPGVSHCENSAKGFSNIHLTTGDMMLTTSGCVYLRDDNNRDLYNTLMQSYTVFHTKPNNYANLINSLFDLFYNYILSLFEKRTENAYAVQIRDMLILNISESEFHVNDYLDTVPFNNDYLCRLFIREFGETPKRYLLRKRLEFARDLLANQRINRLMVKEISEMCGFADPLYFSRVFKEAAGMSPADYAELHRPKDED